MEVEHLFDIRLDTVNVFDILCMYADNLFFCMGI